jgi:hypothetical protein
MFVLCILFCFNTNIENRRDNQEWAAGNIGHNTQKEDKQNKIHNTNIENPRDNQEWAAGNIGDNTQNEDKQNKRHNTKIKKKKNLLGSNSCFCHTTTTANGNATTEPR